MRFITNLNWWKSIQMKEKENQISDGYINIFISHRNYPFKNKYSATDKPVIQSINNQPPRPSAINRNIYLKAMPFLASKGAIHNDVHLQEFIEPGEWGLPFNSLFPFIFKLVLFSDIFLCFTSVFHGGNSVIPVCAF